ncbi:DUF192 domain-containing protein [Candidatus Marsarchaeota archaeon]|jgi:uncharacterized membrane protein (UPF0127 family)|nr:DUF192 domain-containing protein [Candidatus Marsarchaeota archaeon]MCL5099566.1 DUF192 domain-containing protein [Candidatus Marsarchaeota archaeon]
MGLLSFIQRRQRYRTASISIGGARLRALIADTMLKRMIGLMYMDELAPNSCMLFTFDSDGKPGIWMRNMRFPIDILWLDSQKRVIDMFENARPCRGLTCKTMYPSRQARYVVETNLGFVKRRKLKIGAKASFRISN